MSNDAPAWSARLTFDELIEVYGTRAVVAALRAHYRSAMWRGLVITRLITMDDFVAHKLGLPGRLDKAGEPFIRAVQTRAGNYGK